MKRAMRTREPPREAAIRMTLFGPFFAGVGGGVEEGEEKEGGSVAEEAGVEVIVTGVAV